MNRRDVLRLGAGFSAAFLQARSAAGETPVLPSGINGRPLGPATPFSADAVLQQALLLSKAPYSPPEDTIPQSYKDLDYDHYREIRFKKDLALWNNANRGFTAELFSAGYIYRTPVKLFKVGGGVAQELIYDPGLFTYGSDAVKPPENTKPGFSGFRIHAAIDRPDVLDEFAVFQGASYFRAKATGQGYGMSARGLAINTAHRPADEFPIFRSFWLLEPDRGSGAITVYALLDSVSVSGAYKFVISAGYNTVMDVECTLFPRKTMTYAGIAPLTSMFYFAPSSSFRADDLRPRVHDLDGLSILNGKGELIWRPLINPGRVQFSAFSDDDLQGFGLLQRERRPDRYQDFDAGYDRRPSVWVEPKGPWGSGTVDLIELPTQTEYFDNIVAFWHPREPMQEGRDYSYRYRLTWCREPAIRRNFADVSQTLTGASTLHEGMRAFSIDFANTENLGLCDDFDDFCPDKARNVELIASVGTIVNVATRRNRISGGHRVTFEYQPAPGSLLADLRCSLTVSGKPVSETWIYRWTA